jgi:hypothetical protein
MIGMYGGVFDDVRSVQGIIEDCTFDPNVNLIGRTLRLAKTVVMQLSLGLTNAPGLYFVATSQRPSVDFISVDWKSGAH